MSRKQRKILFLIGGLVIVVLCILTAGQFGETSPVLVAGRVEIAPEVETRAAGLHTVFVILHDEGSQMPMPYGAYRTTIRNDAKGSFLTFNLTKDNMQLMPAAQANPNAQSFRVKVRLDGDGQGGADQPGDMVGQIEHIAPGTRDVVIKIDRVIP